MFRGVKGWWGVSVACLVALIVTAALTLPTPFGGDAPPRDTIVAAVPWWNLPTGEARITQYQSAFSAVSPSVFRPSADGGVVSAADPQGAGGIKSDLERLHDAGIPLLPTISNGEDGSAPDVTVRRIIHDPALTARHVAAILSLVKRQDLDGINVDYGDLRAADRQAFSGFVGKLATSLHADGKVLSVSVFAKDSDAGYDERNEAQDFAALGRVADQVRIMAYGWHWNTSAAGPVAPLGWVRDVLQFAVSQIPRHKILLGVSTYGYSWVGKQGTLVSWLQSYGLSKKYDVPVHWDNDSQSPWLSYSDEAGVRHEVWFENSYSIGTKMKLAREYRIGGVYLWLVGDEDDGLWKQLGHGGDVTTTADGGDGR